MPEEVCTEKAYQSWMTGLQQCISACFYFLVVVVFLLIYIVND